MMEAVRLAKRQGSYGDITNFPGYLTWYYRSATDDDLCNWNAAALLGAAEHHYRLATRRPKRGLKVRVFTPTTSEHGWTLDGLSVIEIVSRYTDTEPQALYDRLDVRPRLVLAPEFAVQRSGKTFGDLEVLFAEERGAPLESWWHIEVEATSSIEALEVAVVAHMLSILKADNGTEPPDPTLASNRE
jgi:glutamate dehydrogenase